MITTGPRLVAAVGAPAIRRAGAGSDSGERLPLVLVPFDRHESLTLQQAADIAGRNPETIRRWCSLKDIGRRIGGRWAVSRVALLMFLDNDRRALAAYHAGHRSGSLVEPYFVRAGMRTAKAS